MSATDKLLYNISEECHSLMASNIHKVCLFDKHFLNRLVNVNSHFMLKLVLLPFMSWLDHSTLQQLVSASKSKFAVQLLQQFDLLIDHTQPVVSYPIPTLSQLMIPFDYSDYTLVATKCACDLEEVPLQKITDMKALLVSKWEITSHAMQLLAVHIKENILYWMIPKCIVSIVENKTINHIIRYELQNGGITMISILPTGLHLDENATVFKFGLFSVEVSHTVAAGLYYMI